jgi:hypothetical protein
MRRKPATGHGHQPVALQHRGKGSKPLLAHPNRICQRPANDLFSRPVGRDLDIARADKFQQLPQLHEPWVEDYMLGQAQFGHPPLKPQPVLEVLREASKCLQL